MIFRVTVCTVLMSVCVSASAQQPLGAEDIPVSEVASQEAEKFRELVVDKRSVRKQFGKLTKGLVWHRKLEDALGAAKQSGKLVLWIHALGKFKGYV